jgi:hypothetical protein
LGAAKNRHANLEGVTQDMPMTTKLVGLIAFLLAPSGDDFVAVRAPRGVAPEVERPQRSRNGFTFANSPPAEPPALRCGRDCCGI